MMTKNTFFLSFFDVIKCFSATGSNFGTKGNTKGNTKTLYAEQNEKKKKSQQLWETFLFKLNIFPVV